MHQNFRKHLMCSRINTAEQEKYYLDFKRYWGVFFPDLVLFLPNWVYGG